MLLIELGRFFDVRAAGGFGVPFRGSLD